MLNVKTYVYRYTKTRNIKLSGMKQTRNVARTKSIQNLARKKVREHLEELSVEAMNFKICIKNRV
jgi:hypothetical protein